MKPLRSLPVLLFVLAASGVLALGLRLVGAERDGALRSARERLRATAAEEARRLSDFVAQLERRAREQAEGSVLFRDGRFVRPAEPVATITLAPLPGRDPEGEFLLREAERLEASGDASHAIAALSAAAAEGRDDVVRSIALARRSALLRRAGSGDAAAADASASLSLMDAETRATSRDALMLRLLLMQSGSGDSPLMLNGVADPTVVHDLVALLGGMDEAVGLAMLSQLGDGAINSIATRRAEIARMERLRGRAIAAADLAPGRSRAAIADRHAVVAVALDATTTVLADAPLAEWASAERVAAVALTDPVAKGLVVERVPVGVQLPDALVEASIDESVVEADGANRALTVASLLVLLVLAGVAALAIVLRAVRRESEAARSKTEFVARVGHDLRTPLALIRMYGETIASGRVDDAAQTRDFASIVARESERLTRLVSNVLDLSKLQYEEHRTSARIDLCRLVVEVAEAHRPLLSRVGLVMQVDVPADPLHVLGDEDALRGALGNLLENALQHASAGKEVLVRVARGGAHAGVEVLDRGPGLPNEALLRVFERFVRGPGANGKGSGLGLALVREVALRHGGSACASHREGGGLTFTLKLPIARNSGNGAIG